MAPRKFSSPRRKPDSRPDPRTTRISKPTTMQSKTIRNRKTGSETGNTANIKVAMLENGLVDLSMTTPALSQIHTLSTVLNRKTSPLLRLPGEIRNMIWELAMGSNRIEVPKLGDEEGGARRPKSELALPDEVVQCLGDDGMRAIAANSRGIWAGLEFITQSSNGCSANGSNFYGLIGQLHRGLRGPAAFHLPEVCRQIYSETVILAYSFNTFEIGCLDGSWIDSLLPAQHNAITAIQPSVKLAETYTVWAFSDARQFMGASLRTRYPSLAKIEIYKEAREELIFRNYMRDRDQDRITAENWRQQITTMAKKEGDHIEVIFEE